MKITTIQLKRGIRERLIAALRGLNCPKDGEPIYEIDSGKLYMGDGITDFEFLDPIAGGEIEIESATDGQILVFNETRQKWEAKDFADNHSIEYGEDGLRIAGFTGDASQNSFFPQVNNGGIVWNRPLDRAALDAAVANASQHADRAHQEAVNAEGFAVNAHHDAQSAATALTIAENMYASKFWYGSYAEYMTNVVGQGKLTEGTIYFISDNPSN
jgi:hypothetical protein